MTDDSFIKDPGARLNYQIDWSDWLGSDTISSASWIVPTGITQYGSITTTSTASTIIVSGGTANTDYELVCQITTAGGLIDERTIKIQVRQR